MLCFDNILEFVIGKSQTWSYMHHSFFVFDHGFALIQKIHRMSNDITMFYHSGSLVFKLGIDKCSVISVQIHLSLEQINSFFGICTVCCIIFSYCFCFLFTRQNSFFIPCLHLVLAQLKSVNFFLTRCFESVYLVFLNTSDGFFGDFFDQSCRCGNSVCSLTIFFSLI
jgi:hypothetical protein